MSRTELHNPDSALRLLDECAAKTPPRERILTSATELFRTNGFGAVGVEIIA